MLTSDNAGLSLTIIALLVLLWAFLAWRHGLRKIPLLPIAGYHLLTGIVAMALSVAISRHEWQESWLEILAACLSLATIGVVCRLLLTGQSEG